MNKPDYVYRAQVTRIIDGDTIVADIDLGFGVWLRDQKIRLIGINTPEKNSPEGLRATSRLCERLKQSSTVVLKTHKDRRGKYGRYLGEIHDDKGCINEWLIEEGLAQKYSK